MIPAYLVNQANNRALLTTDKISGDDMLLVGSYPGIYGLFNAVSRSSAGTTTVAEPKTDGSILLTDLVISADRVSLASVSVLFNDGTNSVTIYSGDVNDAPINVAIAFGGTWLGWKNAKLKLTSVGNVSVTVACGFVKLSPKETMTYTKWLSRR